MAEIIKYKLLPQQEDHGQPSEPLPVTQSLSMITQALPEAVVL
jgi:hypothetical protein